MPSTSRRPCALRATAIITATETILPPSRTFTRDDPATIADLHVSGIEPKVGSVDDLVKAMGMTGISKSEVQADAERESCRVMNA